MQRSIALERENLDRPAKTRSRAVHAGALAVAALAAIAAAVLSSRAANASETINYAYDARGRLVEVERSGTVNNNVRADYSYDKGDNRTNVNVVSPNNSQ